MKNKSLVALAITASLTLTACQTTQVTQATVAPSVEVINQANPNQAAEQQITLEQAMAHPDWIARSAERSYWAADSSSIFYAQKQAGSELRDIYQQAITGESAQRISDQLRHQIGRCL